MAATIYDLAKAAHVSIATVSKALSNNYAISEDIRQRVRAIAAQIGYCPNARARSFAQRKNGTVLFATNLAKGAGFENPHLFEIVTGIERYLDEKNYSLVLKHVPQSGAPDRIRSLMLGEEADGLILHAGILSKQIATVLAKESLPHLVIGKPPFTCSLSWIDVSHEAAGQLAANYLLDKGYRRILFLMGDTTTDQLSLRRLSGLTSVLEEDALPIETLQGMVSFEKGRAAMADVMERPLRPEVILCTNNYLALGCMQSILAKGLEIPKDIALMTFDNYPLSRLVQPSLTAIEVDMYEMGRQAARFMLQKIRKPNLQTQSFCTVPTLIERAST